MKNMKSLFLFLLCYMPALGFSQKLIRSEYNKESNRYIIETSVVLVKMDLDDILGIRLRSEDTTLYLIATGVGDGAGIINHGDTLIFQLANDSTVVATAMAFQTYEKGKIADTFTYEYSITEEELLKLLEIPLKLVRIYASNRFVPLQVKEKRSKLVSDLVKVFLQEYYSRKQQLITH